MSTNEKKAGTPRRVRLEDMTAEELAIYEAAQLIEKLQPDERLTMAQNKLYEARMLVADFIDGIELKKAEK